VGAPRTVLALACAAAACGKRGDPLPPIRKAPLPVTGLTLAQRGEGLEVRFTAPRAMTDGSRLESLAVELLVADRDGELAEVAVRRSLTPQPGQAWTETLPLPAQGTALRVAAEARSGKRASVLTSPVTLTVREVPGPPSELRVGAVPGGVRLTWTPPVRMPAPHVATPPAGVPSPGPSPAAGAPLAPPAGQPAPGAVPPPGAPQPSGLAAGLGRVPGASPAPAVVGFRVYRRQATGAYGAALNPAPLAASAYEDSGAQPGESLCYVVRTAASTDPVVESEPTAEACLEVRDVAPPAAPLGVTALLREGTAELSWSPGSEPDLASYRVYRTPRGGAPERIAELPASETQWRDARLAPDDAFSYTVTAVDAAGNEGPPSTPAQLLLPDRP
jgi:hypothetical protein